MPALIIDLSLLSGGSSSSAGTADPYSLPIACMQDAIARTLSGTAVLYSLSQVVDAFGGFTDTYSIAGTASCRISATGKMREYNFADAVRSVPEFRLTIPSGTALFARYRVVENGYTYEVVGTNKGETAAIASRALCVRIDG